MIRQPRSINLFRRGCILFITLLAALAFVQPGGAAYGVINRKISGTLPDFGSVREFQVSPEGDYVVFSADARTENMVELFSVPVYGGAGPLRLSGDMVNGGSISWPTFEISSLTRRVVYLADQEEDNKIELYSVPLTGGTAVKLNGALAAEGDVVSFLISPDGQRVIYLADPEADGLRALYSVPIAGGVPPVPLNASMPAYGSVMDFYKISPDGAWVVYRADQETDAVGELYRDSLTGGALAKLNTGALSGRSIPDFKITPNSEGVVFRCDPGTGKGELYSKFIDQPGGPFKLSNIVPAGGSVHSSYYAITPNSLGVVYVANQDAADLQELFSNSIFGGTENMHKLSGTLPPGATRVDGILITPNNAGVVYTARGPSPVPAELYSNYTTGGDPVHLNSASVTGSNLIRVAMSNNGARVVYAAVQDVVGTMGLYSVPVTGLAAPVKLTGAAAPEDDIKDLHVAPNQAAVLFIAHEIAPGHDELFSVSTLAGPPIKVNGPLVDGGGVADFKITPDSKVVVYSADQEVAGKDELYISYLGWQIYLPLSIR